MITSINNPQITFSFNLLNNNFSLKVILKQIDGKLYGIYIHFKEQVEQSKYKKSYFELDDIRSLLET